MTVKRIGAYVRGLLPLVLSVAVLLAAVFAVPWSQWRRIGERAAAVAVGLRYPDNESVGRLSSSHYAAVTMPKADVSAPVSSDPVIPPKGDGGGAVREEAITSAPTVAQVAVKNTSGVTYDYGALLEAALPPAEAEGDVQVLIVHTHTSESYMSYYAGYYNAEDASRSEDASQTVAAVGECVAQELRARGIGVIHDTTVHDTPYSGAYGRSEATIRRHLAENPSIRVVLDIHRDAILYEDGTKLKPTVTVDGRKAAQVMLIVGGTDTAELPNAYCRENLQWGLRLHQEMEAHCEGVMRPLYLMDARYNQGLHPGSLLLEVGTDANTLSEALYSGRLIGKQLANVILSSEI